MMRFPAAAIIVLLLMAGGSAHSQPSNDSALAQIRALRALDPHLPEVWAKYLALQEELIQKAARERPEIVKDAERNFCELPATLQELKREVSAMSEKGLSDGHTTGSIPPQDSTKDPRTLSLGELHRLETSVENWIDRALAENEMALRFSRSELDKAASALMPLIALARERERKQEIVAKIVVIIADVLNELAKREEEERRLEENKGKSDRLEPSAGYGTWKDLARSTWHPYLQTATQRGKDQASQVRQLPD